MSVELKELDNGRLLMLVELHDFHGWTGSALSEDIKFDAKHFNDIERLAITGENKWEKGNGGILQAIHYGESPLLRAHPCR